MIRSFDNAATEDVFNGLDAKAARSLPKLLWRNMRRKLTMLDAATSLLDLGKVPGDALHALKGDRAGRHAIKVNDQFRVTFRFDKGDAFEVRCEDYH